MRLVIVAVSSRSALSPSSTSNSLEASSSRCRPSPPRSTLIHSVLVTTPVDNKKEESINSRIRLRKCMTMLPLSLSTMNITPPRIAAPITPLSQFIKSKSIRLSSNLILTTISLNQPLLTTTIFRLTASIIQTAGSIFTPFSPPQSARAATAPHPTPPLNNSKTSRQAAIQSRVVIALPRRMICSPVTAISALTSAARFLTRTIMAQTAISSFRRQQPKRCKRHHNRLPTQLHPT